MKVYEALEKVKNNNVNNVVWIHDLDSCEVIAVFDNSEMALDCLGNFILNKDVFKSNSICKNELGIYIRF